jgi:hypothetical protein
MIAHRLMSSLKNSLLGLLPHLRWNPKDFGMTLLQRKASCG